MSDNKKHIEAMKKLVEDSELSEKIFELLEIIRKVNSDELSVISIQTFIVENFSLKKD